MTAVIAVIPADAYAWPVEDAVTEQNTAMIHNDLTQTNGKLDKANGTLTEVVAAIGQAGPVSTPALSNIAAQVRTGLIATPAIATDTGGWALPGDFESSAQAFSLQDTYAFYGSTLTTGFDPNNLLRTLARVLKGAIPQGQVRTMAYNNTDTILRRRNEQVQRSSLLGLSTTRTLSATLDPTLQFAEALPTRARAVQNTQERLAILAEGQAALLTELVQQRAVMMQILQVLSSDSITKTPISFNQTGPAQTAVPGN